MNSFDYIAVAALCTGRTATRIAHWSNRLATECDSWYLVGDKNIPAHISLWLAHVPTANVHKLVSTAEEAMHGFGTLVVELGPLSVSQDGHIGIALERTGRLIEAHHHLLAALDQLRNGYIPEKYVARWQELTEEERASIQRHGTRFAGRAYNPHVTIGAAKHACDALHELRIELSTWPPTQEFHELTVFRQVTPGQSIERLRVIHLS